MLLARLQSILDRYYFLCDITLLHPLIVFAETKTIIGLVIVELFMANDFTSKITQFDVIDE